MRASNVAFSFFNLSTSGEEQSGVSIDKVQVVMRIQQTNKLAGGSQAFLGGEQAGHLMPSPTVESNPLLPRLVPIKGREPHPLSGWLREVDVGEVLQGLASKSSQVINDDCGIREILR
jgi:hypothetical protein